MGKGIVEEFALTAKKSLKNRSILGVFPEIRTGS